MKRVYEQALEMAIALYLEPIGCQDFGNNFIFHD